MTDDSAKNPRPRKVRARAARLLRIAIKVIVGAWVFYLVGMNLFLSTPLFDKVINGQPETIDVHYRRGWSFLPGRIHARDLSIRGRDSNVEWILRLDQIVFDVSFVGLTKKQFDVSYARGRGVSFRIRQRLDAPPTSPDQIADLAPIPGLDRYGSRPPPVESADKWSDEDYHLWSPHLEDVIAEDVREIWIDQHRFEGHATIAGRFHLIPLRSVDIGPVHLAIHEGRAMKGTSTILGEGLEGSTAKVTIGRFDPRTAKGEDVVHALDLDIDGHGTIPDITRLPLPLSSDAKLAGMAEVPNLTLRVRAGILADGTRIEAKAGPAIFTAANHCLTGTLTLSGSVAPSERGDRLTVRADAKHLDLGRGKIAPLAGRGFVRVANAVVTGDSKELDLVKPLSDLHLTADIPSIDLPDVRALSAYVGSEPVLRSGRAHGKARLEAWMAEGIARGNAEIDSKRIGISYRDFDIDAGLHAEAKIRDFRFAKKSFVVDGAEATLRELSISNHSALAPRLDLGPAMNVSEIALRTEGFHFSPSAPLQRARLAVKLTGGNLSDPGPLNDLLKAETLRIVKSAQMPFSGEGWIELSDRVARGDIALRAENFGIRADSFHLRGDVMASASVANWDLDGQTMAFPAARVMLTHVRGGFHSDASDLVAERVVVAARAPRFNARDPQLRDFAGRIQIANAAIAEAKSMQRLLPVGSVLAIESGRALASADVVLAGENRGATGTVNMALAQAGVRLNETRLTGNFDIRARLNGYNEARFIDLSGSRIRMRDVEVTHATTETSRWRGDALLRQATLRLTPQPELDARISLDARDASPLLAILLRDSLPKFFAGLTDMPQLLASTRFTIGPNYFSLRQFDARGGDLAVHGLYAVRDRQQRGAFIVEKGMFSGGVGLTEDGYHIRLFGLDTWMQDETRKIEPILTK